MKYEDFKYDKSFIITANEINEYFKVLLKALSLINPDLEKKTTHVGHGVVKLPEGKMSSRTGKVITGEWLINETKTKILELIESTDRIKTEDIDSVSDILAIGAIKYAFLKSKVGSDLIFDFNESISFDGNSGPYLQYTYARCKSLISKVQADENKVQVPQNYVLNDYEKKLSRTLAGFESIIFDATKALSPHILCGYLFDLAKDFNVFYQECPILNSTKEEQFARTTLTKATANVLKKGLDILGIKTVERM